MESIYNMPKSNKVFLYNYGNGVYKVVKGCFRDSGWVEESLFTSKINDNIIKFKNPSSAQAQSRARSRVRELCLCNNFNWFYTQTFNKKLLDRFSIEDITNKIQYAFKYFKHHFAPDFKYVIILEQHKNPQGEFEKEMAKKGLFAYHVHGLVDGIPDGQLFINNNGYYSISYLNRVLGNVSLSVVENQDRVSSYITKYINKETCQFSNGYYYSCSRGLKRAERTRIELPIDLENWKNFDYVKIFDLDLNSLQNDDNISTSQRQDILSLLASKEYNSGVLSPLFDCVKLRFPELIKKLYN